MCVECVFVWSGLQGVKCSVSSNVTLAGRCLRQLSSEKADFRGGPAHIRARSTLTSTALAFEDSQRSKPVVEKAVT